MLVKKKEREKKCHGSFFFLSFLNSCFHFPSSPLCYFQDINKLYTLTSYFKNLLLNSVKTSDVVVMRKKLVKLTLTFFIAEIVTGTFDGFKVTLNLHSFNDDIQCCGALEHCDLRVALKYKICVNK